VSLLRSDVKAISVNMVVAAYDLHSLGAKGVADLLEDDKYIFPVDKTVCDFTSHVHLLTRAQSKKIRFHEPYLHPFVVSLLAKVLARHPKLEEMFPQFFKDGDVPSMAPELVALVMTAVRVEFLSYPCSQITAH
jgi:hypothetical protein